MSVFSKSILKVGEYHAPQGLVKVTPERLKHWEATTKKVQSVGYALPSHFNHPNDPKFQEPITMDALKKQEDPAAQKTVGRLQSFKVAPDGQSAEIVLETLTNDAKEKVAKNAVYVSPVIAHKWKDGAGNQYDDMIVAYDLVDWPVDYSQSGFVPAIAMSLEKNEVKPFMLSVQMDGENPSDIQATEETAAPDTTPAEDTTDSTPPATNMGEMLAELSKLQVVLPDDTDGNNFIDRLLTALKTRNAVSMEAEQEEPEETPVDTSTLQEQTPAMATMSLQVQRLQDRIIAQHKRDLNGRVEACLKQGKCTPAQAETIKRRMNVVTMSLGDGESISAGDVDSMLAMIEANAPGSQWTDEQRTDAIQLSLVEPPEGWGASQRPTKSDEEKAVEALTRDIRRAKA